MDVRGSTRAAAGGRPPNRPSAGQTAVICAAGALVVQVAVLAVVPPDWRLVASTLATALALTTLAAILIRARPQAQPRHEEIRAEPPYDADELSPQMRTAYELARRGVPAVWIAQHCDLPQALAELVVADAHGDGGGQ